MRPVYVSLGWEDSSAGLGTGSLDYSIGKTLASWASLQEKWDYSGMRRVGRIAKDLDYRLSVIPHPLTPSSPFTPSYPFIPSPLISSLPLPSSPHPAWPDPQLSRSQEVPSYIKQEKHSAWFSAAPRGHQHPGPVGLCIMMIQSLQANPQALPCLWQLCCQQGAGR